MTESTAWCGKGLPGRKRKEIVVEFDTEDALKSWGEAIQRILDESGSVLLLFLLFLALFGINPKRIALILRDKVETIHIKTMISLKIQKVNQFKH